MIFPQKMKKKKKEVEEKLKYIDKQFIATQQKQNEVIESHYLEKSIPLIEQIKKLQKEEENLQKQLSLITDVPMKGVVATIPEGIEEELFKFYSIHRRYLKELETLLPAYQEAINKIVDSMNESVILSNPKLINIHLNQMKYKNFINQLPDLDKINK